MLNRLTITSVTTAVALIAGAGAGAFAAGSDQQREACTPDAFRLCSTSMPDEGRVENCLRAAGPRLSAACHEVFFPQSATNQTQPNQPQMTRAHAPSRERMQPSAPDRAQTPSTPQMPPRTIDNNDD
jgi:hypothetical protein